MKKIRVLVVDDSAFMRKIICDILSSDSSIEVVDTARDGAWALEKLKSINVDVITMDVEMPNMNGLDALKKINELYKIPVLMLSSFTSQGADITIKALETGAFDFVLKPSLGAGFNIDILQTELIKRIKMCCQSEMSIKKENENIAKSPVSENVKNISTIKRSGLNSSGIKAVCIAASTGGPKALSKIMADFPANFNLPVLVVQHMPAGFTKAFANRLDGICKLSVKEAEDGDEIKKGYVYIAPGGYHMVVSGGRLRLNKEPPMHGVRPCADKLFISAAEYMNGRVIGIVLTGMGKDGTAGMETINRMGGICIAEDESTCTIYGMPKSAIEKGVVHVIAPLDRVIPEMLQILNK